jgi:hypothetical protein
VAERGAKPGDGAELVEATAEPDITVAAPRNVPGGRARARSAGTAARMPERSREKAILRHRR